MCEYCEEEKNIDLEFGIINIFENGKVAFSQATYADDTYEVETENKIFNYCPMCGRKLGMCLNS